MFSKPELSRIPLVGRPQDYETYGMALPLKTHWVPASCEEVNCEPFLYGFVTTIDVSTPLGQKQYDFLIKDRKRTYSLQRPSMHIFKFIYPPGTICMAYADHKLPKDRPGTFYKRRGDYRLVGQRPQIFKRPEDWVDEFGNHQLKLAALIQKG
jgi:hypothetical protein